MDDKIVSQAERVVALEAELESAGQVSLADAELARCKAALHEWVESVVGVIAAPGVGRVTLIHSDGNQTGISSRTLPFLLSRPARFEGE